MSRKLDRSLARIHQAHQRRKAELPEDGSETARRKGATDPAARALCAKVGGKLVVPRLKILQTYLTKEGLGSAIIGKSSVITLDVYASPSVLYSRRMERISFTFSGAGVRCETGLGMTRKLIGAADVPMDEEILDRWIEEFFLAIVSEI